MAIQVRRGNEEDFNPEKMRPGEWAVSLDTKYVRMCFSPGVCLRMATYEGFEEDMAKIEAILEEVQSAEEAVELIQTEINNTAIEIENNAKTAEEEATKSKSYAVGGTGTRENEEIDNARYYYNQLKQFSQGISGVIPMGTITFAELPSLEIGDGAFMYNISDAFVSDERFNDGGGINYGAGNNVFWTAEGKWDVTASSAVSGVKGSAETDFRTGNVIITPENLGLGKVLEMLGNVGGITAKFFAREEDTEWTSTITNVDDIPVNWCGYVKTSMGAPTEGLLLCLGFPEHGYKVQIDISLYGGGIYYRYLAVADWSEWEKPSAKDLAKYLPLTGGQLKGSLYPNSKDTYSLGWSNVPWKNVDANDFRLYKNGFNYGVISSLREGTTDTTGASRMLLGNSIPEGTAGNAVGAIVLYGRGSGYTQISPTNDIDEKYIEVRLPSEAGTLALLSDLQVLEERLATLENTISLLTNEE